MFKVSFKETPNNPSKIVVKKGKRTEVTLKGVIKLPSFWTRIPEDIMRWIEKREHVEIYEDIVNNILIIYSAGKSVCCEDDKYDSVLGERLAESRSKYYIYKFMYGLAGRLEDYYSNILFGDKATLLDSKGGVSQAARKYAELCIRESHHLGELLKDHEEHV